ncbi:MAG: MBL fold metallo-hydrolase [Bacillota bacterium]|nr:MBL fold metallo-hydrolase [Bacillota bacterium]
MVTRRIFLKHAGLAGAGLITAPRFVMAQQAATTVPDRVRQFRNDGANTPIKVTKLRENLFLLQGVGGNMLAQTGPDGTLLIDSSASTAAPHIREALQGLNAPPLKLLVNTHWHYDHTDGNAALHDSTGVFIIAHENTRKRLSTPQEIAFMQMHFAPDPPAALPQQTFTDHQKIFLNNDELHLVHFPPAHTDTDIYIHFVNANVLHAGDTFFNGFYPFIDGSTGGNLRGMVRAAETCLALADNETKIVPGHGPLGDKASLQRYHAMLSDVADKVEKLKASGKSREEVVAARPTSKYDAEWGKGLLSPDQFAALAYQTL